VGAVLLVVVAFADLTWHRNTDYRTAETMWRDVVQKRPDNMRACLSLSTVLLSTGQPAETMEVTRRLLARLPDYSATRFEELERRWRAEPSMPVVEYAMAHNNVGAACLALGHATEAETHCGEAARVVPRAPWAHCNLAKSLYAQGRIEEAVNAWRTAVELNPKDPQLRTFLAVALAAQGQDREAIAHYRAALASNPDDAFVRVQLAWTLATHADAALRDGAEAVRTAQPLLTMTDEPGARALDVLAAAYAEAGRMEEAIRTAEHALHSLLLPTARVVDVGVSETQIRARLALYRQGLPFRESVGRQEQGNSDLADDAGNDPR